MVVSSKDSVVPYKVTASGEAITGPSGKRESNSSGRDRSAACLTKDVNQSLSMGPHSNFHNAISSQ